MQNQAAEYRRCLIELDVAGARALWRHTDPHLPQPKTDAEALFALHVARTVAQIVPPRLRYYSHRWLCERGKTSMLPDHLRASADRMYPVIADAVGIASKATSTEVSHAIVGAQSLAVLNCYANGDRDPVIVKTQMIAARARERKALGLPLRPELPPLWSKQDG